MSHYDYTKSRVLQWIGIILILGFFVGAYWYFQARAAVNLKTVNETGLVGYWPMNEGSGTQATDFSGSGNTGTLVNSPSWTTGKLDQALSFNGSGQYVDAGTTSSITGSHAFTLASWINTTAVNNYSGALSIGTSANQQLAYIGTVGAVQAGTANSIGGGFYSANYGSGITTTNKWVYVVMTFSGGSNGTVKLYVDGIEKVSTTDTPNLTGSQIRIGRIGSDAAYDFNGKIDEPRIYSRALSATEITGLYTLGTATVNASQNTSITNGLVGQWSFNGDDLSGATAYDRSGSGNNGTLTNSPTITEGKIGQALRFDGGSQYVNLGTPASLALSTSFTISAWVYLNSSFSSGYQNIVGKWNDAGGINSRRYTLAFSGTSVLNGLVILASDSGGNVKFTTSTSSLSTFVGKWVHVVGVTNLSNSTQQIYINGVLDANGTAKASSLDTTETRAVEIGNHTSNTAYFNGKMDEVRIYNRALSVTEIQSLYDLGQSDKINSSVSQPQGTGRLDSGLAGYWKLDENSGSTAADSSTNGNTGTLTNGPTWTTGHTGSAVNFDGVDDYIATSKTVPGRGTFSAWVNTTATINSWNYYSVFGAATGGSYVGDSNIYLQFSGYYNRWEFWMNGSYGAVVVNAGPIYTSNTQLQGWHLLTASWDTATGSNLYIDGALAGTSTATTGNFASMSLRLGFPDQGGYYPGKIDDARLYSRVLSADEVSQLYRLTVPTGVDTSLKGYWSFNGQDLSGTTAYDRSGSGNNGTLTNSPTITEGKIGQALSFNGTNQYVLESAYSFSSYTWCAWMKSPNSPINSSQGQPIGNGDVWGFSWGHGESSFQQAVQQQLSNGSWVPVKLTTALSANTWYHICGEWDGTTLTAYLNGVVNGTPAAVSTIHSPPAYFLIGGSAGSYFNGAIDEVRIYNRALSAAEVTALYNVGAVAAAAGFVCGTSTVTFTYNGSPVTYGTVTGADGKCWMDRNLGATQVATSATDSASYGHLFQWGRLADGHQITTSGTTGTQSTGDVPGNANFITGHADWRSTQNDNLWQGVNGVNNPCPTGWRLPTSAEWATVVGFFSPQTSVGAFNSALKLPVAGDRVQDGSLYSQGSEGHYWSSGPSGSDAFHLTFSSWVGMYPADTSNRAYGFSVRCVKD